MINIIKKDWPYLLLILFLLVINILSVNLFRYGFFTAYDESYFLLKLKEAYEMSCITGKSQWNLIAIHWFPYLDLTSKVNSYLASSILKWATVLVATATACVIYDKNRVLKYLGLIYLLYCPVGEGLSYVPMQTAVMCWSLCAFMLFRYFNSLWAKRIMAVTCGICLGLSMFIIIPASLMMLVCVVLVIVVSCWDSKKQMFDFLLCGVIGVCLSITYIHVFICDIREIIESMLMTAGYIGKSGYGYDGGSFVVRYVLFVRDLLLVILSFIGAYCLSKKVNNKYIGAALYVSLLLVYFHYQVKPAVTASMIVISLALLPILFAENNNLSLKSFKISDTWMTIFLLLFPLIASLGTNTYLGGRITEFTLSWIFLFFYETRKDESPKWNAQLLLIVILYCIPLFNVIREFRGKDDTHHFTRGNKYFAEISLTKKQADYFNSVYDILEKYNYKPKQSVVLTAAFDYCCLYAFDAVNAANYHQVQNFHYFPKDKMIKPDFIFMCKWDSIVMAKELIDMQWGWPEEFDEYYVGTPEPDDAAWVINYEMENRKLYCRKSQKQSY